MTSLYTWLNDSVYTLPLSPGCTQCALGAKMVLLVTGQCSSNCFYCPLSQQKKNKDVIYADEWKLTNETETDVLIKEAESIDAQGAGITGGDPLFVWKRTTRYIQLLKDAFGEKFHIHLYTAGLQNSDHLGDIINAGLDELRFHPLPSTWQAMEQSPLSSIIQDVLKTGIDVAMEIPVIPDKYNEILSLLSWANEQGIHWVNLNELEFSETNMHALTKKGYTTKDDLSAAVRGSQETAFKVVRNASEEQWHLGVHYCSVSFKDGIQLRNRITRRAHHVAYDGDIITDEGTLLRGCIEAGSTSLKNVMTILLQQFKIPQRFMKLDLKKNRVLIAAWHLEDIAEELQRQGYQCFLIEEYPTADHLEVERIPLPLK